MPWKSVICKLQPTVCRDQVREKAFSIGDQFKIKDDDDNDVFIVKSKIPSVGDSLTLEDADGK